MHPDLEKMAERYADDLWDAFKDPKDWAWEDNRRNFIAGARAGLEMAAEVAKDNTEVIYSTNEPPNDLISLVTYTSKTIAGKIRALMGEK